ncbi:MAG: glucosaminidase domain-containing protein [Paramuribaculum sp.]|nr:glucosaminidase domain-containing protein [Paramuribaculum sp.]
MKAATFILLLSAILNGSFTAESRYRKPLKKIQQDTIVIPEDIIFDVMQEEIEQQNNLERMTEETTNFSIPIMGEPEADAEQMYRFIQSRNPDFEREIAEAFYTIGKKYGVRGDIALCQSALETGWFKFTGGTAVTPDQHNYCGLGVTRLGIKGHSFDTIEDGVTAQIQHLYAYATKKPIPYGETILDPRFSMVSRGIAPTWHGLNNRWAANPHYADRILNLFSQMINFEY